MPKITINGTQVEIEPGLTLLQAIQAQNVEVPVFCYHPRLQIAGNCRMCLVEVERSPKPVASCATPVVEGMIVHTDTEKVRKARQGVLEFLLINHPLDCPICDQGGECDLQDITMSYGCDNSRFHENKRAVSDKYLGPLVKTSMNRCIHCTRCIRFMTEIAGVTELGAVHRGEHMEVTNYIENSLSSEISANIIDICPVGALTSKPYAFQGRPWELTKTETIDVMDAIGSNIRVDSYGCEVKRILPRLHEEVNEEWISDKTRFAYDGLLRQRLDRPYVRKDGKLQEVDWPTALEAAQMLIQQTEPAAMAAITGDLVDCEAMTALRDLWDAIGSPNIDCRQDGCQIEPNERAGYLLNSTIAGLENADCFLLIGTNVRLEAPLVNARIRKAWLNSLCPIGVVGNISKLNYDHELLSPSPEILQAILEGKHTFSQKLEKALRPAIIIGMGALCRADGAAILYNARAIAEKYNAIKDDWCGFNVLQTAAARVGGLELGLVPRQGGMNVTQIYDAAYGGKIKLLYLLGADELDFSRITKAKEKGLKVIYQGHHGDVGANNADIIFPGAAYTEKDATYVNMEGRVQMAFAAVPPPGVAKEDWRIIRALSEKLAQGHAGKKISYPGYMTIDEVRARMCEINPIFCNYDKVSAAKWGQFGAEGKINPAPLFSVMDNFYFSNVITRSSPTMAACSKALSKSL